MTHLENADTFRFLNCRKRAAIRPGPLSYEKEVPISSDFKKLWHIGGGLISGTIFHISHFISRTWPIKCQNERWSCKTMERSKITSDRNLKVSSADNTHRHCVVIENLEILPQMRRLCLYLVAIDTFIQMLHFIWSINSIHTLDLCLVTAIFENIFAYSFTSCDEPTSRTVS